MKTAKEISIISVFVALLISGQLALSAVSGIEIVTALTVSFFYFFGLKRGLIVATAFSLLRCIIFGFIVNVVILYLIYYNLLALVIWLASKALKSQTKIKDIIIVTAIAVVMTVLFTMIDNVLSLVMYGLSQNAFKVYVQASLLTMVPQMICVAITVPLLFVPLIRIYKTIKL